MARSVAGPVLALLLGLLVGAVGSFAQEVRAGRVPAGLLLALLASAVAVALASALGTSRLLPVAATVGWLVAVVPLSGRRPEGDLVVSGDTTGYVWAYGGMALVACTCLACIALAASREGRR
ncbi:hypothetical protein CLV35_2665 [Motilibacter peucedani]|uniref:Uncharacterized protein n=1 Tax=Motilibacter peucedani TaxID=598650 RepID=A0A420XM12_9ACTN|nr:hypothetical protein CLV35_2665 [Motilibacter peucedani]